MDENRNKNALSAIQKLKKARDEQAKKIDILCNDIVGAHAEFVGQLTNLTFGVNFYKSLLGRDSIAGILSSSAELIKNSFASCSVAFFLVDSGRFELHVSDRQGSCDIDSEQLAGYFTPEVANNICRSNKVCMLEDMYEMGLIGNLAELGRISAAAIPLGQPGCPVGFILLYRSSQKGLERDELVKVVGIRSGLCRAIKALSPGLQQASDQADKTSKF
ncbi:MAG: hypothetical protein ACYTFK_01860 [Planctomycetota bacterium]